MITEKGTLPIGVELDGKTHKDFELRPQFVSDTVDIFEDPEAGKRAARNNQYFACCLYAGRLVSLGDIPKEKITPDLILSMRQEDYNEILGAGERLETQEATFREPPAPPAQDGAGAAQAGV